ncbi:MAG: SDR family oxidoreductase [Georgfuchsia sp.]
MSARELFDLTGKIALVTGGSRGLGLQMAEALGEMGCKVAITARKKDELADTAMHLGKLGIDCLTVVNDMSRLEQIPGLVDTVLERYGTIDILVNNAGASWAAPAEDFPTASWNKVMDVNINGVFLLCREVGKRAMIPRQSGKIINIASTGGLTGGSPDTNLIAYATSKGAVVNFTRALASEWGKYNINVNAICPGLFPTRMSMAKGMMETVGKAIIAATPLHRLGGDEDMKGSVVFLASEASRHITGQYIAIDGGASTA